MKWLARALVVACSCLVLGAFAQGTGERPLQEEGTNRAPASPSGAPAGPGLTGSELEATTERVASLMRCPSCQGLSVADSPMPTSLAMKGQIRRLLAEGYDEEQVLDHFEAAYGEFIRLAPRARGFNWVVWLAPGFGLLVGAVLVARRMRPGRATPNEAEEMGTDLNAYRQRVREELRQA